jgi:hypothetical protein
MANHGKVGEDLALYHARKARPHAVSGLYAADGAAKPQVFGRTAYLRKLHLRGANRSGRRSGKDAPAPSGAKRASSTQGIVHWRPVVCRGRAS